MGIRDGTRTFSRGRKDNPYGGYLKYDDMTAMNLPGKTSIPSARGLECSDGGDYSPLALS